MRLKGLGSLLLVAVVLVGGLSWPSYGQKAGPSEKAWEYKIEDESVSRGVLRDKDINEYGAQGWELVAVTVSREHGLKTFYFKRPK